LATLVDRKSGKYLYQQSKSTDIWSLGLIFYFMLTGKLPYADIDDLDVLKSAMCSLKQVNLPKEANKLPRGFRKALGAMLQVDPELRPSIEQVLILIKESDSIVSSISKSKKRLNQSQIALPVAKITAPSQTKPHVLDENTRISLALIMVATNLSKFS
jgi:serine/threonine protein kinase